MKIGKKTIKLVDIPKQKKKFRETFSQEFKGYMSKSPLVWLGDVVVGAACMFAHAPATPIVNCMAMGAAMTAGGALGGIPLAFAGGLAGGLLAKKFNKSAKSIKRGAIIGSFTLGALGIVVGNVAGYRLTKDSMLHHDKNKEHKTKPVTKTVADKKTYILPVPAR